MRLGKGLAALSLGALLAGTAAAAWGTTLHAVEVRCPVCGAAVKSREVGSTNSFGGQDFDLLRRAAGDQPFMAAATTCPRCHYSGYARDFVPAQGASGQAPKVSAEARKAILDGKGLKVPAGGEALPAWARLDLIAQVKVLQGGSDEEVGWAWLNAAWAVRLTDNPFEPLMPGTMPDEVKEANHGRKSSNRAHDDVEIARALLSSYPGLPAARQRAVAPFIGYLFRAHGENEVLLTALPSLAPAFKAEDWPALEREVKRSIERERGYQRLATAAFERALASGRPLSRPEARGVLTYLVGETARRLGQHGKAREHYDRVGRVPQAPDWIVELAREQEGLLPSPSK